MVHSFLFVFSGVFFHYFLLKIVKRQYYLFIFPRVVITTKFPNFFILFFSHDLFHFVVSTIIYNVYTIT